jgi:hypothetical protein
LNDITQIQLNDLLSGQLPRGTVVILVQPEDSSISLGPYEGKGFFLRNKVFPITGGYTNTNDLDTMISDQITKLQDHGSSYFGISWTLTQQKDDAVNCYVSSILPSWVWWIVSQFVGGGASILELTDLANAQYYNYEPLIDAAKSSGFPNIVWVNDVGPEVGLVEMAMEFNSLNQESKIGS